jgi:hypothetical protein
MAGRHAIKLELTLDQMNLVQGVLTEAMNLRLEKATLEREAMDLKGVIDQL